MGERRARRATPASFDTEFLTADGSDFGESPRCEVCGEFVGMRPWAASLSSRAVLAR
jgi:hypothetical protein